MDDGLLGRLNGDGDTSGTLSNADVGVSIAEGSANPVLKKNLAALGAKCPLAAKIIAQTPPSDHVRFMTSDEGIESAELDGIALASKRKPMHEARRLSERVEPTTVACCAMLGFGIGYHCGTMLERLGSQGVVVCFEPDVGLLRAVLERIDYSAMFATKRLLLIIDPDDSTTLNQMFEGIEAIIGLGVEIVEHPPSIARLGSAGDRFLGTFGNLLKSLRTHVITTLAHAPLSFRNALMNLDHYASSAGIVGLKDSCIGKAAVVVSAGPSLEKNLGVLRDPEIRASVVVVAVQTVLKVMLAEGIKPDFVAALDYHEISTRFYEGLSAADVEGIRLVVEPKANPAILDAFPGEVLCVNDELLDKVLGAELSRALGEVPRGGTVAHLCYYFARYLGCDPVILIGQDLGFSDGQYYASGAAIHHVWGCELNAHNTLEMMEWERIVRMRSLLRKKTDIHGRAIYSDEQMSAYLAQFESDFQKDAERGLRVIDASEGGVRKLHTKTMTLKDALDEFGSPSRVEIPSTVESRVDDPGRGVRVCARIDTIIGECGLIAELSEESITLLRSMIRHHRDQKRVNRLIRELEGVRDRVMEKEVAFYLTESVNQVGVINRMRRDRVIEMGDGLDAYERQKMQIERDITNVEWTRDAARSVARLLESGRGAFLGETPKQTSEHDEINPIEQTLDQNAGDELKTRLAVHAMVIADPRFGGLGCRRDLRATIAGGLNTLELTIRRLDQSSELDAITIVTPEPDAIKAILGSFQTRKPLAVVGVDPARFRERGERIACARVQSGECWRGSISMLCVYDEQFDPGLMSSVMHEHKIDGCAIVGADWAMIDPGLVDRTVARFRTQESDKRIAFSQAAPGLGAMVVDRETIDALAGSMKRSDGRVNHFATIGALIGYIPVSAQSDPIAKGMCVPVDPSIRDCGVRLIADTPTRIAIMRDAYQEMSSDCSAIETKSGACVEAFGGVNVRYARICPSTVVLETCTGRLGGGDWSKWKLNAIELVERPVLSIGDAHRLIGGLSGLRQDVALVFDGVGDPLMHPQAMDFVHLAKEDGIGCVELRSDLLREGVEAGELLESGLDILSVDLFGETEATYAALSGVNRFDAVYRRIQSIFDAMGEESNHLWFVARMTKCDAVYNEIEQFYDKWRMLCGSAVIDPLVRAVSGQRIRPLVVPQWRRQQLDRATMRVRCDGVVVDRLGRVLGGEAHPINAIDEGIEQAYQRMCSAMRSSRIEVKAGATSLAEDHAA